MYFLVRSFPIVPNVALLDCAHPVLLLCCRCICVLGDKYPEIQVVNL